MTGKSVLRQAMGLLGYDSIEELSGLSEVLPGGAADNQLTECGNVWYKDGALRTRPALIWEERQSLPDGGELVFNQAIDTDQGRARYMAYKSRAIVSDVEKAKVSIFAVSPDGMLKGV